MLIDYLIHDNHTKAFIGSMQISTPLQIEERIEGLVDPKDAYKVTSLGRRREWEGRTRMNSFLNIAWVAKFE